jgi:glycosyltransferase involved in cell wall biosynthesis
MKKDKSIIYIQTGARRHYALAKFLYESNLLHSFWTDLLGSKGVGKWLSKLPTRKGTRLASRQIRDTDAEIYKYVFTADLVTIKSLFYNSLNSNNSIKQNEFFHKEFNAYLINNISLKSASIVFSMFTEAMTFMEYAKNEGLKTVSEIYIAPSAWSITENEKARLNLFHLENERPQSDIDKGITSLKKLFSIIDYAIVPSEFVKQDIISLFNYSHEKIHVIPYAVHESWLSLERKPIKNRILFVGTAEIRKGIHILVDASEKLKSKGLELEIVVAGGVTDQIRNAFSHTGITFLGRVPRTKVQEEFQKAAIFVFPSLAEGSAEVVYEALASGLPVITTKAAGSVVEHGKQGFIIPEGDSDSLVNQITFLLNNPKILNEMSNAARERAKEFKWSRYQERFLNAMNTILDEA